MKPKQNLEHGLKPKFKLTKNLDREHTVNTYDGWLAEGKKKDYSIQPHSKGSSEILVSCYYYFLSLLSSMNILSEMNYHPGVFVQMYCSTVHLKGQCHKIFDLRIFFIPGPLIHGLKPIRILLRISSRIRPGRMFSGKKPRVENLVTMALQRYQNTVYSRKMKKIKNV
jgi:hypothetical protein